MPIPETHGRRTSVPWPSISASAYACWPAAWRLYSFVFAFFYLRAVNSNGLWRPSHVKPLPGYGIAVLVCIVGAAVLFDLARRSVVAGTERNWRAASLGALPLGVLAVVAQLVDYHEIHFHTAGGGYASVF